MIRPLSKRRTVPAVLGILLSFGMVLAGLAPAQEDPEPPMRR